MRVERERAVQVGVSRRAPAETALDHPAVEELERIASPQPERALRVGERLVAVPVPGKGPGEHIIAVDTRTIGAGAASQGQRVRKPNPEVDDEERSLEVGLDAVGDQ
jgi:hypothetical protein